jgi:mRNA interferase RelE/StbE
VRYELALGKYFRKEFDRLEKVIQDRVLQEINQLLENPKMQGVIQLTGQSDFRTRVGDYRIIFDVNEQTRVLTVLSVGHRSEVYER